MKIKKIISIKNIKLISNDKMSHQNKNAGGKEKIIEPQSEPSSDGTSENNRKSNLKQSDYTLGMSVMDNSISKVLSVNDFS